MAKEAYLNKLKEIQDEYETKKKELYREYGLSNALFKVGDTIKGQNAIFIVDKITIYKMFSDNFPEPVYHGFELRKDLTPKRSGIRAIIYGNNAELVK